MPLLSSNLILEPAASFFPGFGRWAITRPRFTFVEYARVTFPTEQCARAIALLPALSVLPFSFGTTHSGLNVAVTEWAALIVTTQVPVPEQSPVQPANREPEEALAVSVTDVPCA